MKTIAFLVVAVLAPVTVATQVGEEPPGPHATRLRTKITRRDGTVRTATLDGVGCTVSICSRTLIKGNGGLVRAGLDSLAAIRDTTSDSASLVLKGGSRRACC